MSDPRTSRPDDADPGETRSVDTGSGPATPARDVTGGREWGDLRLTNEIGHGGFGRVYRGWDETLAREVAVKIIKPKDAAHRAEVLREGKMLARVKHPNVVTVFRAQQVGDEVGITMELIHGRHLSDVVAQSGRMGADEAAVIGITLCQALGAVHGAGLLHRDVKARNVMREDGGRIVLMDFGAGRESVPMPSTRSTSDVSGTPLYLAPELLAGGTASPASDLYSLGVLLFYLVTRKYPVEGTRLSDLVLKHAAGERRLLADLRPDLPAAFVRVVDRALEPKPERRYQSAGGLMRELSDAMQMRPAPLELPPLPPPPPPQPRESVTLRWTMRIVAVTIAIWILGFLTTVQYDVALSRPAHMTGEGVGSWFVFGFRSIILLVAVASADLSGGAVDAGDLVFHPSGGAEPRKGVGSGAQHHLGPIPAPGPGRLLDCAGLPRSGGLSYCGMGMGVLAHADEPAHDCERGACGADRPPRRSRLQRALVRVPVPDNTRSGGRRVGVEVAAGARAGPRRACQGAPRQPASAFWWPRCFCSKFPIGSSTRAKD